MAVVAFRLDSLRNGPDVRGERFDLDHVTRLAEVRELPPITVRDGRIVDGHHRVAAARRRGEVDIEATVIDCTDAEALELAVRANTTHGLPLTIGERRRAAVQFIGMTDWSDSRIADACGLSDKTVGSLRPRTPRPTSESPKLDTRNGKDGKARPATNGDAAARRQAAAEKLAEKPEASDREVARGTGLSPSTVGDVRARTEAGEDPVPPRLRTVPDPEPPAEPGVSVRDITRSVALPWKRDERCQVSNAARDFARVMDRFTGDALKKVERTIVDGCPPGEVAHMAAGTARDTAAMWARIADQLSRPRPPKEA